MQSMIYGQNAGEMRDRENARIWEEINADDHRFDEWHPAITKIKMATAYMHQAVTCMDEAADKISGTGMQWRIADLSKALEDLADRAGALAKRMEDVF